MMIRSNQQAVVINPKILPRKRKTAFAMISTFEGISPTDEPMYSIWRTFFIKDAYQKAVKLKDKDKIILTNAKVENNYDCVKGKLYISLIVFDFEMLEKKDQS